MPSRTTSRSAVAADGPDFLRLQRSINAELCRRSLAEFVKQSWHVVEPGTPLVWGRHVDAICEHLQAVTDGRIKRLIVAIAPGHMKSLLISVFWPAWEWVLNPCIRSLYGSHDPRLAARDAVRTRDLLVSDWFRRTFEPAWRLKGDQNTKSFFQNSVHGFRWTFGMGGQVTGWRGDKVVLDDPLDAKNQFNSSAKEACEFVYNNKLSSRVNNPAEARFLLVMQRLSADDLAGRLLERMVELVGPDGLALLDEDGLPMVDDEGRPLKVPEYQHLCLPTEYDPDRKTSTSIGWTDWRTEPGELLFPAFFTPKVIAETKQILGPDGFASQHQQSPVPAGGGGFKDRNWCYWEWAIPAEQVVRLFKPDKGEDLVRLPLCRIFTTVDPAAGVDARNDPTAYHTWAVTENKDLLLLDELLGRMEQPDAIAAAKRVKATWKRNASFVVEGNGLGKGHAQGMARDGHAVEEVHAMKDKWESSRAAQIRAANRQVYLPKDAPWLPAWKTEVNSFPGAAHDERVTTLSIAAEYVYQAGSTVSDVATASAPAELAYKRAYEPSRHLPGRAKPRSRDRED